jgi:hypothetical protein
MATPKYGEELAMTVAKIFFNFSNLWSKEP